MCEKWKVTRKTKQRKAQDDDDNCPPFLFLCYAVFVFPVSPLFASLVDTFIPSSFPSCYGLFFFLRFCFSYCILSVLCPVLLSCVTHVRRYNPVSCVFLPSALLFFVSSVLRLYFSSFREFSGTHVSSPPPLFHLFSFSPVSSYLPFVFCGMF